LTRRANAALQNPRAIQEPMILRPQGSLDRHLKHDTGRDMR
jgi:hypothetical protein